MKGRTISKTARVLTFDFETDALLLEIDSTIPFNLIKPLLLENEISLSAKELISVRYPTQLIQAGFHADSYLGQNGEVLTYDDTINVRTTYTEYLSRANSITPTTVTFSGGSGGPLIAKMDLREEDVENPYDQMYAIGYLRGLSDDEDAERFANVAEKRTGNRQVTKIALGTNKPRFIDYNLLTVLLDKYQ